ncbi:octaprenyl-diphosphate synthase [Rickettsia rhipicephali]|nr:octaprenyl-diphosphate synthase [Rickettsia rhipicephali]
MNFVNHHCERLKGAWQSQDFGTRLLSQNFQFFLAMTEKFIKIP